MDSSDCQRYFDRARGVLTGYFAPSPLATGDENCPVARQPRTTFASGPAAPPAPTQKRIRGKATTQGVFIHPNGAAIRQGPQAPTGSPGGQRLGALNRPARPAPGTRRWACRLRRLPAVFNQAAESRVTSGMSSNDLKGGEPSARAIVGQRLQCGGCPGALPQVRPWPRWSANNARRS